MISILQSDVMSLSLNKVKMFCRSIITLTYLCLMGILCFIVTSPLILLSLLYKALTSTQTKDDKSKPCVVIFAASKSKALHHIRLFKDSGYRTVAVGSDYHLTCGSGWSIYCDKYYTITAPLCEDTTKRYINDAVEIVMREQADVMMQIEPRFTIPADVKVNEILGKQIPTCTILAFTPETYACFDNKVTFNKKLHELGIRAPQSKIMKSNKELLEYISDQPDKTFILKPLEYVPELRVNIEIPKDAKKLEKFLDSKKISEERQFIVQEKLIGPESSSCTLVVDSRVIAYYVSDQSVDRMWMNSVERPQVDAWVKDFLEKFDEPLTGFLTFDHMFSSVDGQSYPLECNPRVHTGTMLFQRGDNVISEFTKHLADKTYTCQVIKPRRKETFWLLREIALILQSIIKFDMGVAVERIGVVVRGNEAVFEWLDPLPFLVLNFVQIPGRIVANLFGRQLIWNQVDYMCGNPLIN